MVPESVDLRSLIGHSESVQGTETLETVRQRFSLRPVEFIAVLDQQRLIGLCTREQIGMVLGSRYGFSLHARQPIQSFPLKAITSVTLGQPISEVLTRTFSREDSTCFDDVALVDPEGRFLGLIYAKNLARLQNSLLQEQIRQLELQQSEINRKNEEMEDDIQMAREIQLALLPEVYPSFPKGASAGESRVQFRHHYRPAGAVSGDFFQIFPVAEREVGVFICDVMGHGVRSAFVTAMMRALVEELQQVSGEPGALLTRLNRELITILRNSRNPMFATAFYMVLDPVTGRIRFARAGHPSPLHLQRHCGQLASLAQGTGGRGAALGLFEGATYDTLESSLSPRDAIFLFTDGLFEVLDVNEEEFGVGRLQNVILAHRNLPLDGVVNQVLGAVEKFSASVAFPDDVCLVAMELTAVG